MLSSIRKFAKTKLAGVFVAIIIIPFAFWGMGSIFSSGNTNNVAKINDHSISVQDLMEHINLSKITLSKLKADIDENILDQLLSELISKNILILEMKDLNLSISDNFLNKKIRKDSNFLDENNNFSRVKYEKFLLSSNMSAPDFEYKFRQNELKRILFYYISGGVKSPLFFTNVTYKKQSKKINLDYINLEKIYKKKDNFSDEEIKEYINLNRDKLKEKIISFNYSIITPKALIGVNEYNNLYFEKIDEIDNEISSGTSFKELTNKYKLSYETKNNYKSIEKSNDEESKKLIFNKIYKRAEEKKLQLLDENDYYLLYKINKVEKVLPSISDDIFKEKVNNQLQQELKYKFNKDLMIKISNKNFKESDFTDLAKNYSAEINNIETQSIKDVSMFNSESVKYLYSLSKNSFALITDVNNNVFLINIKNIYENEISKKSENFDKYNQLTNADIVNNMFNSYDSLLNNKYKIKINEKTLERVKNYFR